jgi:hypothetical protein
VAASRTGHFTSREIFSSIHSIVDWVDFRTGLEAVAKRKNSLPVTGIEPLPKCLKGFISSEVDSELQKKP